MLRWYIVRLHCDGQAVSAWSWCPRLRHDRNTIIPRSTDVSISLICNVNMRCKESRVTPPSILRECIVRLRSARFLAFGEDEPLSASLCLNRVMLLAGRPISCYISTHLRQSLPPRIAHTRIALLVAGRSGQSLAIDQGCGREGNLRTCGWPGFVIGPLSAAGSRNGSGGGGSDLVTGSWCRSLRVCLALRSGFASGGRGPLSAFGQVCRCETLVHTWWKVESSPCSHG